jgi:hypothetical protein
VLDPATVFGLYRNDNQDIPIDGPTDCVIADGLGNYLTITSHPPKPYEFNVFAATAARADAGVINLTPVLEGMTVKSSHNSERRKSGVVS